MAMETKPGVGAITLATDAYRVAVVGGQVTAAGTSSFGQLGLDRLDARGIEWHSVSLDGRCVPAEIMAENDALLLMEAPIVNADSLANSRVRHIARFGAGHDSIDLDACSRAGVIVTNTPDAVRVPMAHAAISMVFALAHNLVQKDRLVRDGEWSERVMWHGRGLDNATVGIVGLGGVGAEIARLLVAMGISVAAFNRSPKPELTHALGIRQLPLDALAESTDFLIVTVAGGAGTRELIDSNVISRMKAGSFLINLSRGSVIDESAVIRELNSGRLRGAALDVFQQEPLPHDSPLISEPRVILSPHSLCWTEGFSRAVADSAIAALLSAASGEIPQNSVNPTAWERISL